MADGKIKASDANSAATKTLLAELAASEAVNAQKKVQLDFDQALRDSAYATATARSKEVDALTQSNQKFAEEIELIGKNEEAQRAIIHARESSTIAIKAEQLARMDLIGVCSIESEALRTEIELLKERQSLGDTKSARIIDEADTKAQKQYTDDLKKDLASAFSDALKSTKNPIEAFGISLAKTVASRLSASLAESLASASLGALGLGGSSTVSGGGMAGGILGSLVTSIASAWAGGAVSGSVSAPSAPSAGANYSLASSASSSSLSGIKLAGYRAEGGDVEAGKMYRVNERGPEVLNVGNAQYLMMGGKNGHVSKNTGAQGQGGGRTVHVNTTINLGPGSNADDFRRSKSQIEASLARTVRGAMA